MSLAQTISFTRGVPPQEALEHVKSKLQTYLARGLSCDVGILQYGHHAGHDPLRLLLAAEYAVPPDQVMVGNGSLQLLDLLARNRINSSRQAVFTEEPTYDRALKTFRRNGGRVTAFAIEMDGLDVEALERRLKRITPAFLYLVPDFQNPTGITMSLAKRVAVVMLAEKYGFYIIEDVPYRQLRYTGEELPLMRELSPDWVITISSYSKLIAPGLRVGYAIGPAALIAELVALGEQTYLAPTLVTQAAVAAFIADGRLHDQVEWLKQLYQPRMAAMLQALATHIPGAIVTTPEGGFFVSAQLPTTANVMSLRQRASSAGVLLTPGREFFAGNVPAASRFLRLRFCAVSPEDIEQGVLRLAGLL